MVKAFCQRCEGLSNTYPIRGDEKICFACWNRLTLNLSQEDFNAFMLDSNLGLKWLAERDVKLPRVAT